MVAKTQHGMTFIELIEAINTRKKKDKAPTEGNVGGKPKAAGSADFAASHGYPVKPGGETDRAHPAGSDDVLNARDTKETDQDENEKNGERDIVQQGTAVLKDLSGFMNKKTKPNFGDNQQGDINLVRGPSSVEVINEDVVDHLEDIVKSNKDGAVSFEDGDTAKVNLDTAKNMLNVLKQLNQTNAKKFHELVNKDAEGFLKMLKFSANWGKGDM